MADAAPLHTACPLDCPDACSLEVEVDSQRLARIDGDRRNPVTDGFICAKVRNIARHVYGPDRLQTPAVRRGAKGEGTFEPVGWDEALDLIANEVARARAKHGGESILPICYGGSNGLLSQDAVDLRLWRRLGASRLLRTVCAAPSSRACDGLYGRMPGVSIPSYERAGLVVVWGCNPSATGIHLVPRIRRAQRAGAKLVVVDPRRIPLSTHADLHLAPRPGTDLPLALAIANWLIEHDRVDRDFVAAHVLGFDTFAERARPWTVARAAEVCDVPATDIESLARLYADTPVAALRCGWGPERNRNGGSAIAAILALPAIAGKFGVAGGGFTMSNSKAMALDDSPAVQAAAADVRSINMNRLGEALLHAKDPRIEVLFCYNCNPLATLPAQRKVEAGLRREDLFTVVFDQVMTDTARFADVILPATTFLEHDELGRGYGSMVLNRITPVIPPVGEARPNHVVFGELCRRLELTRPGDPETADELIAALVGGDPRAEVIGAALRDDGVAGPAYGPDPVAFVDVFPGTADQKVHLVPQELDDEAPEGLYHYAVDPGTLAHPLALISPAMGQQVSSTFGQLHRGKVAVRMHPADAAPREIEPGDAVRIFNDDGEVHVVAAVDPAVRPGVAVLPKGLWAHHTLDGHTANAVAPDALADLAGGATFNDARVQIERIEGSR